jgi:glutathione peroxidase
MLYRLFLTILLIFAGSAMAAESTSGNACHENLNFTVRTLNGNEEVRLCEAYQGKVVLIVNTASKCAFTGQYEDLEALYAEYQDKGLVVLGFPSNDFGNQDPGSEKEIQNFCRTTYGVQFPMFQKSHVKKKYADPLFRQLGEQAGYPKWNFYKYLLNRKGELVDSYSSISSPGSSSFKKQIEKLLAEQS